MSIIHIVFKQEVTMFNQGLTICKPEHKRQCKDILGDEK